MATIATTSGLFGLDQTGAGDAVPIVFLHGVGSDRSSWGPQLAHFGATRRAIALDAPGYGDSDPLPDGGEGEPHDRFAAAILAALDALGVERAHLCGLSFGGVVAIACADQSPGRIASLILCDTFAVHPDGPAILARALAASTDMRAMAVGRAPLLLAAPVDPALVDEVEGTLARIDPAAFRTAASAVWPADQRERATRITAPTLILCGAEDRITPPALSEELGVLIPHAAQARIEGAGHLPNLERPTAFNAAVERFLASVDRPAG